MQDAGRAKPKIAEEDRIGFGESGHFDSDIFGTTGAKRFEGYNESIAPNDDDEDDDDEEISAPKGRGLPAFSAPAHILKDIPQVRTDHFNVVLLIQFSILKNRSF